MSGCSTLQQVALYTVELTGLRKVSFPPASSVMWPSPARPAREGGGMRTITTRLERLERRQVDQAAGMNQPVVKSEYTPEHHAEVLHILCACGVFAVPADPESPDAHPLQTDGRTLLHARGVLDDDGYLVAGVTAGVLMHGVTCTDASPP